MTRIRKGLIATTLGIAALDGSLPTDPEATSTDPTMREALLEGWSDADPLRHLLGNGGSASDSNRDEA